MKSVELPNGKTLEVDDLCRIKRDDVALRGWFKFWKQNPNGDLAFYGPVNEYGTNTERSRWRAFRPEEVSKVMKPRQPRSKKVNDAG